MTEESKKRKTLIAIIPALIILLCILVPVIMTSVTSHEYIITNKDDLVFRGRKLFICGDTLICMRGNVEEGEKSKLPGAEQTSYNISILPLKDIRLIELEPGEDEPEIIEEGPVDIRQLGSYKIQLQGYTGKLRLYRGKDKITGTVQFPDWANGKVEYLKNIKISGDRISFTRSAPTDAEVRRLGANSRFTQRFNGKYSGGGRYIKGFLINQRKERHQWDAQKER